MRCVLILPALLVLLTGTSSQANDIDQDTREFCLEAKDYLGCIKANMKSKNKEQKSKPFNINHKHLNRPQCERVPIGKGQRVFSRIPCELCHQAYAANLKGKSTILSGNKEDKKEWIDRIRPKVKHMYPASVGISSKRWEKFIGQKLNNNVRTAKNICPSLY